MIHYLIGDATQPIGDGPAIIAHVCNDLGGWGAGFTGALSRRYVKPERDYRLWHAGIYRYVPFILGRVQFSTVRSDLWIANMLAQRGYSTPGQPAIRYNALTSALHIVAARARDDGATVHVPRIGCGLAGGTWDKVEPIIEVAMGGLDVYVYDLE